ncbi:hypothetical protein [Polyangium jinanense]|uniref:Tetratricopeptide repeat protein n=1 Tax=Polyangium jinanense TaxID=2829994 RepID=A0A9X4ASA9_9BACT|nr:hypothetical protein [Polyangium jinanense]MDC3956192.1 hypothetical protein [Polyangium jinanense]MDC3982973.1 hypothetical protein [Polyangium jinanense]
MSSSAHFSATDEDAAPVARRATMPPPELADRPAPTSAGSLVLEANRTEEPILRHNGPRAEIAYLRGRVARCREAGDAAGERESAQALAQLLASRETELDTAVNTARRALELGEDEALRSDVAEWLAGLGEPVAAAEVLRASVHPSRPASSAQTLLKIAVLLARGADPKGAAAALKEAAALDSSQPMPLELIGTIAAWAQEAIPKADAAAGYLTAAARHEALEDADSALEDRLRAFEIAPEDEMAANTMVDALAARGAAGAADEALRDHALAAFQTNRYRARQVHLRRVSRALDEGNAARAIAAVLDAGIVAEVESDLGLLADRAVALASLDGIASVRRELRQKGGSIASIAARAKGSEVAAAALLQATLGASKERERADALVQIAAETSGEISASLLAVAAEGYLGLGIASLARRTAEDACLTDPTSARALSALARATIALPDLDAAMAVEGGASTMLIRSTLCEGLAKSFETVGEMALAVTWTQRWLALRPGCPEAMRELVRLASQAYDPDRLEDALGWVLAQPRPLDDMASLFGDALALLFELDAPRAIDVGRRALDMYGPRVPGLRGRLLAMSDRAGDAALGVVLLERLVSADTKNERTIERLFDLAQRRAAAEDWDGAAAELARAAGKGAESHHLHEHLDALDDKMQQSGASLGSDGLVSFVEARVRALGELVDGPEQSALENLSSGLRDLGAVRWDLAQDPAGAEDAFWRAAVAAPRGGMERYARDLVTFAGSSAALDAIVRRSETLTNEPRRRASLLIEAANLAVANGLPKRALEIGASAIQIDPSRAEAVAIVERSSAVEGGIDVLDRTYDVLAAAALGCYGRRAAHYRGARQLERRGAIEAALRHAVACFEAVPSEGTSYFLMARLAERGGNPTEAIRAIERVSEAAEGGARAAWLKRAASLAKAAGEGSRMRFDLLLRALSARPDLGTVEEIGETLRKLVASVSHVGPLVARFENTALAALKRTDGPDGARVAVALAKVAFSALGAHALGLSLVERAVAADGDIDEYDTLVELAPAAAAGDAAAARAFLESLLQAVAKPYASVGVALLRLGGKLAHALGDPLVTGTLLVQAARRAPEDELLVSDADAAVFASGDAALARDLDTAVPPDVRLAALLHVAERREREGNFAESIETLERALRSPSITPEQREAALSSMRRLFVLSERASEAEAVLASELARQDLGPMSRVRIAVDLSTMLAGRGEDAAALDVLKRILQDSEPTEELLATTLRLARRTGDRPAQVALLNLQLQRTEDAVTRASILRELAALLEALGDHKAGVAHLKAASELAPDNEEALEGLEAHAASQGDHAAVAEILGKRIAAAQAPDLRRTLRLRRAAVLEQRLSRLEDACAELDALLAETPDDPSALRFLADIRERLGSPLRAAPLWQRLGELSAKTDERAEYGIRAANDWLAGGNAQAARNILESIAPIAARDAVIELRVSIARHQGDARTLSEALDQLATASREPADKRASYLVEAARASSSTGDEATALDRVRRAVRLAPHSAEAVLEARRLEYRARGGGTPREAQHAIDELMRIGEHLTPEQMELQAFLLAEELDVIQGGGAGMRELSRRHAAFGPAPLIALGMAERLVRNKNFDAALPLFERALSGDLRGLRSRGRVALAAADAALAAGQLETASRLLDTAAVEPDTRPIAMRKKLEFIAGYGEPEAARAALFDLIRQSAGLDRARFLYQLGRLVVATDPDEAIRLYADAFPLAAPDRNLAAQIAEELAHARRPRLIVEPSEPPAPPPADEPLADDGQALVFDLEQAFENAFGEAADDDDDIPIPLAASAIRSMPTGLRPPPPPTEKPLPTPIVEEPSPPAQPRARTAPPTPAPGGGPARETALFEQLMAGSYDAGERLVELYGGNAEARSRDLLVVRKHQASLRPGDRATLQKLHEAALLDRNGAYARAVDHVLAGFDPAGRAVAPPPLSALASAPELVLALLFRNVESPINEALAITWETGRYRREPSHYGLTGALRVQPGAPTVLGDVWGSVTRVFGAARPPLFHRRAPAGAPNQAALNVQVALLAPPAVVLTGEIREETPELRYLLGASIAGAMPEHVLVRLPEEHLRTLIEALRAAFGPVGPTGGTDPGVARLGQDLWQIVPPRGDRRLREIFAQPDGITYEAAIESARRAARRAGFFASGDLPTALRLVVAELKLELDMPLTAEGGLARACAAHPALADLVRLATRSEYAEARFRAAPSTEGNKNGPPSRFRGT